MIEMLERAVGVLSRLLMHAAAAACLGCLALVCYAVGMRYFVGWPVPWTDEAVGWMIVVAVMLAVPEAQRRGENIAVDLIFERARGWLLYAARVLSTLAVLAVGLLLLKEGVDMVQFTRTVGIQSMQLPEFPLWVPQSFVPLGGALLALVAAVQLVVYLRGGVPAGLDQRKLDQHE